MTKLFANSGNPDLTPHSVVSDLGLHCLQIPFYGSPDYNGLSNKNVIQLGVNSYLDAFPFFFFFFFCKQTLFVLSMKTDSEDLIRSATPR